MSYQRLKQQVLERDKYTCQICLKKSSGLDIHHIIPRHRHGLNTVNNLVSVCESCHLIIELKRKVTPRVYRPSSNYNKMIFYSKIAKAGQQKIIIIPKNRWDEIKDLEYDYQVKVTVESF